MSAENAGSIYSEVDVRLDKIQQDLNLLVTRFQQFGKKLDNVTAEAGDKIEKNVTKPLINVQTAAIGASAAIAIAFKSIFGVYAQTAQNLSNVQAATKATAQEMALLQQAAVSAGDDLGASMGQSLTAIEALSKAGVSNADIMGGALPGALELAAAGNLAVADAAEIASATMTQFGLAGEDVTHIADLLAAGAGKAQGEVSDLSMALKQAGLVASQTGLSVEDTVGALSAFASAGLLGSDAGTSFRTMLLRLTPQSKEAADKMEELGIKAFDANGNFVGLAQYAQILKERLGGLTVEQRNAALATVFGSDSIRAANILYTQGAKGIEEWTAKVNDAGYAADIARIKLDNWNGDLTKLQATTANTSATIGDALDPVLRGTTQAITEGIKAVGTWDKTFLAFVSTVIALTGAVFGLGGALGALGVGVSALFGPIGIGITLLSALTIGLGAASAQAEKLKTDKAKAEFEGLAKTLDRTSKSVEEFYKGAAKAQHLLETLAAQNNIEKKPFGMSADEFAKLAKSMGLTVDELALITIKSDKANASMKLYAQSVLSADAKVKLLTVQQKEWEAAANDSTKSLVDRLDAISKLKPTETTKAIQNLLEQIEKLKTAGAPALKTTAEAWTYLEDLVASGAISSGEALDRKISFLETQLDTLVKTGLEEGKNNTEAIRATRAILDGLKGRKAGIEALNRIRSEAADEAIADEEAETEAVKKAEEERAAFRYKNTQQGIADSERLRQKQIKDANDVAMAYLSVFSGVASALGDIFGVFYQRQIDDASLAYNREKELIENNGLTKKQVLENNLATAQATGDAAATADAQRALDLYNLEADFIRKKAQLEYEAAMASWRTQVILATAKVFEAALNAYAATAAIPIVGPSLALGEAVKAGAFASPQLIAIAASVPQPPKFHTGGIVLGQQGAEVPIVAKSKEMVLTEEQQAELFKMANGSGQGGMSATIQVILDPVVLAQSIVRLVDNGVVKMKAVPR